jgi:hypothetical protein
MAAAVLFGAVHALMPGHGKSILVSYHLGQPTRLREGLANGAILALTHVGLAVVLVLAGFTVISRAFAFGGRTPQFEVASGVLIALIGANARISLRSRVLLDFNYGGLGALVVSGKARDPGRAAANCPHVGKRGTARMIMRRPRGYKKKGRTRSAISKQRSGLVEGAA